jgi:putative hemolysin
MNNQENESKTSNTRIYLGILLVFLLALTACTAFQAQPETNDLATVSVQPNLPNPASVYCEQQGNRLEIRTAVDGSQSGICILTDEAECDEWAYYRGECGSSNSSEPTSALIEIPTALPIDPADYQGWWTYSNSDYGFSIQLPEDWIVDQTTSSDPLMNYHLLMLHPKTPAPVDLNIRMTFRQVGEDTLLWPTGVGQGEFIDQGTLSVAGVPARRILLVCPTGEINSIWYHSPSEANPNIQIGDLEFGFILSYSGTYCQEGYSLGGKVQLLGEMIIASLRVP